MKILVFNYEYPPIGGGGGVICKDISEELALNGNDVTVITSSYKDLKQFEIINDVKVIRVKVVNRNKQDVASLTSMFSYLPASISKAKEILTNNKFDIINTHFAVPTGPAGQFISKKFHIPNVLSIHGGDIYDPSKSLSPHKTPLLKQIVKKTLEKADTVVAQSSDTKKNAQGFYNIKRDIEVIPLGIKPNKFSTVGRSTLGISEGKLILCTVGRLVRRKNLTELISIFNEIKNQIPSELLIIGDGPEMQNLKNLTGELNLNDDIKFLGRVSEEEKFQYLSASDIYVSTAMHEGFGIVFLEAMECSLPVICYDKGGQVDFLKDGITGYLIKHGDKEKFKQKLLGLACDKNKIKRIGSENKSYVRNFYIRNIANQYLSLFNRVINNYNTNKLK